VDHFKHIAHLNEPKGGDADAPKLEPIQRRNSSATNSYAKKVKRERGRSVTSLVHMNRKRKADTGNSQKKGGQGFPLLRGGKKEGVLHSWGTGTTGARKGALKYKNSSSPIHLTRKRGEKKGGGGRKQK